MVTHVESFLSGHKNIENVLESYNEDSRSTGCMIMDWKYEPLKEIRDKEVTPGLHFNRSLLANSDYFSPFIQPFWGFFSSERENRNEIFENSILEEEVSWHSF